MKYLRRLQLKFEESAFQNPIRGQVRGPEQLFGVFKDLKDETKEALLGVYLDERLELNSYEHRPLPRRLAREGSLHGP